MRLAAVEPFLVPPDVRALAVRVFMALARVRFVRRSSLLAYAGAVGLTDALIDAWRAAGLFHEGAVAMDPLSGGSEAYLALTPSGARALSTATGTTATGITPVQLKRASKRSHDVAAGELGLAILTLQAEQRIDLDGLELDDRRIATSATITEPGKSPRRVALQADAYAVTRGARGPVGLLVEVDRGTVAIARMAEKYAGYLAWHGDAGPERDFSLRALRVATIAPDERRLARLHAAALAANGGRRSGFLLFALDRDVRVRDAARLTAPIAQTLGGEREPRVPLVSGIGLRDAQATRAPARGTPPGRAEITRPSPGNRGVTNRPLAVAAPPSAPML